MKEKYFLPLLFLFLFLSPPLKGAPPTPPALFQQANAAYQRGDYPQAISLYESILSQGGRNANLYYNLANAYVKEKRFGPAILYYERAKRIDPWDFDTMANLNYARGLLEYRIEDKRNWYLKTLESLLSLFTEKEIGIVGLVFLFSFLASWAFSLYVRPAEVWGWKRKTLMVLALTSVSLWLLKGIHEGNAKEAVVLKPQATVRYGPSYKDQVAFRLGEGMKVQIRSRSGEWSRVVLTNGETGWMSQEEMEVI